MARKRLILFDIDGTMVDTGGAGMDSLRQGLLDAFPDQTQGKPFPTIELGGATDAGLVELLFPNFGIEINANNESRFFSNYCEHLLVTLQDAAASGRGSGLTGVSELVNAFDQHSDCYLGLLTGNIEKAARIKLEVFDLFPHLFPVGAYGNDYADRNKLGPVAIERANFHYQEDFQPHEVVILGDTTKDIACARACGAKAIAVATGSHDSQTLSAATPDWLVDDFSDYQQIVDIAISE